MAGAVGGVAGALHGRLAVIAGVTAELALRDAAVGRATEREPHVLQLVHGVDDLVREHLGHVLVGEVVTALNGVEGVPLGVVLADVP